MVAGRDRCAGTPDYRHDLAARAPRCGDQLVLHELTHLYHGPRKLTPEQMVVGSYYLDNTTNCAINSVSEHSAWVRRIHRGYSTTRCTSKIRTSQGEAQLWCPAHQSCDTYQPSQPKQTLAQECVERTGVVWGPLASASTCHRAKFPWNLDVVYRCWIC